jgi:CheY-like chemotaxis protein
MTAGNDASRARVLIVDDDPDTRWMTEESLRAVYDVTGAAGRAEALLRARRQGADAIVVDLALGSECGWDLIRALQTDPGLRTIPIVVLSASRSGPPPGVAPLAAQLTKPCRMQDLREVLARCLSPVVAPAAS